MKRLRALMRFYAVAAVYAGLFMVALGFFLWIDVRYIVEGLLMWVVAAFCAIYGTEYEEDHE